MEQRSVRGHADFRRLWAANAISQFGSSVGIVAIPVVAVTTMGAQTWRISLLSVITGVVTAVCALPVGRYVEFRRKRPVMVASDLLRFAGALSIPVAAAFHVLTFTQLCVVTAASALGAAAMTSAAGAHLKALVPAEMLVDANGRLLSSLWLSLTVGPGIGGALLAIVSAPVLLIIDAFSFLGDALIVRRIRQAEPSPADRVPGQSRWTELAAGLRFTGSHPTLRKVLASWMLFAGASAMATPILTVYYLRHLHFAQWQYGFILGAPSIGGFLGARLGRPVAARLGPVRTVFWAGIARSPWFFVAPLVAPGMTGFVLCCVAFFASLLCTSLGNSTMAAYRQLVTPSEVMARTTALWLFAPVAIQPLFVLAGGVTATLLTDRTAILVSAMLMLVAALTMPRRETRDSRPATPSIAEGLAGRYEQAIHEPKQVNL